MKRLIRKIADFNLNDIVMEIGLEEATVDIVNEESIMHEDEYYGEFFEFYKNHIGSATYEILYDLSNISSEEVQYYDVAFALEQVEIRPEYRGQGIGEKLIEKIFDTQLTPLINRYSHNEVCVVSEFYNDEFANFITQYVKDKYNVEVISV